MSDNIKASVNDIKASVTVTEAAALVGVSRPTIYACIEDGSLPAWRMWSRGTLRIHKDDLAVWMKRAAPATKAETAEAV